MVKYKKTLPGPPYVRSSPLTEGFQPGVGYIKNLFSRRPLWAGCSIYIGIATVCIAYKWITAPKHDRDMLLMNHEYYKVRRREEIPVEDLSKECFN